MVGPVRPLFVLFGSSIVQISFCNGGWGAILSESTLVKVFTSAYIITRGYFGWNSRRALQILDQVFPKSLSDKTRVIFLTCPPINEAKVRINRMLLWHLPGASVYFSELVRTNELCRTFPQLLWSFARSWVIKEAEKEPSLHWRSMATEYSEDSPYDLVAADGERTLNPSEWTYYREIQWE
ncbi:hypothetical protein SASPL_155721 [Salvia splendens]|uniref:Uncharacterized protein n=1 Tax=Salvia splendens TaxID=180675 RepID=A0A8X8VXY5_SALSN|nr:hypothetical protein SASPL_155721 [Salvia splendens]